MRHIIANFAVSLFPCYSGEQSRKTLPEPIHLPGGEYSCQSPPSVAALKEPGPWSGEE